MCGFAGVVGPKQPEGERAARVQAMTKTLVHRGPDDEGYLADGCIALGHRRLAIIDLAHNKQPMQSADGRHWLVFNGEIYNYLELRTELESQGERFTTRSDTEVLLAMLRRYGVDALPKLIGMFAFFFVDRETGEWLLARDPFGIKPLYYAKVGDELAFASEIKALLAHGQLKAKARWDGLQEYFAFQFTLAHKTMFEGVARVEPGCCLRGRGAESTQTIRYWDFNFEVDEHHTEAFFTEQLKSLLQESARLQIRSDVPLGAYLSGGLDSTVISLMAGNVVAAPLQTFHGKFLEGAAYDESAFARTVAGANGFQLHEVAPTAQEFVDDLPHLIYMMDEPTAGPGLFPQYRVSKLARQHVKVVLGGQGGDELFSGYARYLLGYLEQALKGAITETQEEGKHIVTLSSIIPNLPTLKSYVPLMKHFWSEGLFEEMDRRYFRLINRAPDIQALLSPDAAQALSQDFVFGEFQDIFNRSGTRSYINKMLYFDLHTQLPALLHVEDRVSMAVGLESRVPFLDPRIADLVCTAPPDLKFHGGHTKHLLRNAVGHMVPKAVLDRKDKMGFPVPLKEWMQAGPVREFVTDTLTSRAARERGLFSKQAVTRLLDADVTFGRQLWGVLCLELWHQRMIDGAVVA